MAKTPDRIVTGLDDHEFGAGSLIRMASWGIGASAALFLAVLATFSESARPRVAVALATLTGKADPAVAKPVQPAPPAQVVVSVPQPPAQPHPEVRRLHEQVRLLAADRDRLVQRVSVLERNLEDVTGSIRRQEAAVRQKAEQDSQPASPVTAAAATTQPPLVPTAPWPPLPVQLPASSPWADTAPAAEPAPETTASVAPSLPVPSPRPDADPADETSESEAPAAKPAAQQRQAVAAKPEPAANRPAYGIDLGGATSIDRLRLLWQTVRTHEAKLLQGLRPIAHVREVRRGGRPDIRLIAGPLPTPDDAAKLCAEILHAGRYCEPAVFHGQRLSLR